MQYRYKEFVAAFTGPRGGCKTANEVLWGIDAMVNDVACHSNQPIGPVDIVLPNGQIRQVQSVDLDYPKFLTQPEYFFQVLAILDEIQLLANSLRTTSNGNLLLQQISSQIRKQEMSLFYSVQDIDWADGRFRFQTDVEIECTDLAFSPWGMEEGLGIGELAQCIYKDLTGIYTGRPYYKYPEAHVFTVPIKDMAWGTFDTRKMVDPSQGRKAYTFEKEQIVIKQGPEGTYVETKQNAGDVKMRLQSILNQMTAGGYQEVTTRDLWGMCSNMGIDYDHRSLGILVKSFGLEKKVSRIKGEYYVFPTHPKHSLQMAVEREQEGVAV